MRSTIDIQSYACCKEYDSTVFGVIKEVQPDILIFALIYTYSYNFPIVKNDSCVEATNKFFADIKPYAKVIILPDEEIAYDFLITQEMAKRFNMKMSLNNLKLPETKHRRQY
uniref:Uncharacterized protein n=1 Tax=Acrobeloides nanus TaxID=290746 RepID=A0A914EI83_9BILA